MKEKLETLYDELHDYLIRLVEYRTTSAVVPEVARVMIELAKLQSKM